MPSEILSEMMMRRHHYSLHDIVLDKPAVRISEAGLIGNGALGVAVRTRPDAVLLHFGHNSVWNIRTAAVPEELYGTFEDFWKQWKAREQGDERAFAWTEEYSKKTNASYDEKFPRPWPCGTLVLGFDVRKLEVLGHRVRLADGVCQVNLRTADGRLVASGVPGQVGRALSQSCSSSKSGMWVKLMRIGASSRLSCTLPKYTTLRP